MSDQNQEVLIRINIDEDTYKKKIVDLQKEIISVKKQEQELAKAIKEAGSASDEQATQQVALKARLKELNAEQRVALNVLDSKAKADKAALGSIDQMRAQLAILTRQWNELSEEERENTALGKTLGKQTKELSDKLKEQEKAIGDTRRSVGDYAGGILSAVDGTGLLATITAKASQAQAAYTATLNLTKASLAGNITMLKAFKLAMAATGIGLVVVILGSLVSWLTRTQEGIDFVSQKTKGFTTVLGAIIDNLSAFGKRVIDFVGGFENLGDAVKKLGQVILDHLITRFKGLGVIIEGIINRDFTKIQDGIMQVGAGITDATAKAKAFASEMNEVRKSAEGIEKEFQRIRDAEIALQVERDKSRARIKELNLIVEDQTKSEKERSAAAREALAIEDTLLQKQVKLQADKVANIKANQALTNNLTADNKELADAESALYQLQEQSLERVTTMNNKLNQITKEGQAKALEATKKQIAAEAELLDIRSKSYLNSEEDVLELQVQIVKKKAEAELLAEKLTQAEIRVIKERAFQEEEQLRSEFREEQRKQELEETERTQKAAFEVTNKMLEVGFERQDLLLKQQRAQGLLTAEEYQQELANVKVQQLQGELLGLQQFEGKVVGIEEEIAAKKLELSHLVAERQIENINRVEAKEEERQAALVDRQVENLQLMGDVMSSLSIQLGEALATQGNALEQFSANVVLLAIDTISKIMEAQVAASVGQATVAAIASPESVATAGVAGVVKALALVALIRGAAAYARAAITKSVSKGSPDVFAEGGFTGSGSGSPDITGYKVAGVVHEDEWVAPKWMVENPIYADYIAGLEQIRQRGYATGGYAVPLSSPRLAASGLPPATREYLAGQPAPQMDYDKLAQSMSKYKVIADWSEGQKVGKKIEFREKIANQ